MIACDVVLLPDADTVKRSIELNRRVNASGDDSIVLDAERCLPHITLVMGCIDEPLLDKASKILKDIAANFPVLELDTIHSEKGPASVRLRKTRDIELLHEIAMIRFSGILKYKAEKSFFFDNGGKDFHEQTLEYINAFPVKGSFENYTPHITVGYERTDVEIPEFKITADTLALCHLGDLCTCRKVLDSARLIGRGST